MKDKWKERLACATHCSRCSNKLGPEDQRILSVYDHQAICTACKKEEEERPDYPNVSKEMIGQCMAETEVLWGDPEGYCFHHFYPFKC
jgi:hypothetical protein